MGGPPLQEGLGQRGHGPSSIGGAGAQFHTRFEDVRNDFSKFHIDDKKANNGGAQRSKSTRRVSFKTTKGAPKHYEYYSFNKSDNWRVADRIKISAPQEELEKTVAKGKKSSSVLDNLKKMSRDRRAQIDRLLDQKNLGEVNKDAQWHCVFIDSPSPQDKEVGGKRIREHREMNVIVAQHLSAGRAKSASGEKNKSFAGERSDINDPLKPKDKIKDKDQPSKGGKDGKDGNDRRDDPFDRKPLFTDTGIPMDKHGPIPGYPPPNQPFDPGMGYPYDPPGAQPMGAIQTSPPGGNQLYGDPLSQPQPGHQLHHGIEIFDDPPPPLNGANNFFHADDRLPPGGGHNYPPDQYPHFQPPHTNEFNGPQPPSRKQPNAPFFVQEPPKGRRHHTKKRMNDNSSRESDDDYVFFDEDDHSSHTSYDDHYEKLPRRGSLVPHRRSSTRRREPTYREHHRVSSYPIEPYRRIEQPPPRDIRYPNDRDRVETIIERRPRRHSRGRREAIKYTQPPKRLEYQPGSPPLTPISSSSYSPSRRFSGLLYPHEFERDWEHERLAEYMREKDFRDREEAVHRRERDLDDRDFFDRSRVLDRVGRRVSGGGQERYWSGR
jgi:hypothetical protein